MIDQDFAFSALVVRGQLVRLQGVSEEKVPETFRSILQNNEELKTHLSKLLKETSALGLVAESGIPGDRGFLGDLAHAVKTRILPRSVSLREIVIVFDTLFPDSKDWKWLIGLRAQVFVDLTKIASEEYGVDIWKPLRCDFFDALELLAARVVATGLSPTLRAYAEKAEPIGSSRNPVRQALHDSAFFRMQVKLRLYIDKAGCSVPAEPAGHLGDMGLVQVQAEIRECWLVVQRFSNELASSGVSVDVVSRLQVIRACLSRIEEILYLLTDGGSSEADYMRFLAKLVRLREQELRLSRVVGTHLSLIALKITEHAGEKGEHYVTRTKTEYRNMFVSASGAGVLTGLTCLLKTVITGAGFAPLWEAALTGLNYSVSFLVLYHFGLGLATKQSSVTAAHLAAALANEAERNSNPVGELAAHISRSQLVAVAGNLLGVVPAALVLEYVFRVFFQSGILSSEKASKVLTAFDFLNPSLWLYAAVTGVILWLSSLFSGLAENFSVFHKLPLTLAQKSFSMRIHLPVAAKILQWFGPQLKKHLSGWAANVSLGVLLAVPALVGRIIGVAADVRHVTLGAGLVALASVAALESPSFVLDLASVLSLGRAFLGVLLVGAINITVSFWCSLFIAMLARNETVARVRWVVRAVVMHLRARPKEFFLPPP